MGEIILTAECDIGYSLCKRGHVCKSDEALPTEVWDWQEQSGRRKIEREFHLCPHLILKAKLEGM